MRVAEDIVRSIENPLSMESLVEAMTRKLGKRPAAVPGQENHKRAKMED